MRAALAVAIACSTRRACNKAAPSALSAGMSRVLAKPGSGALASTAAATASVIAVLPRELFRICTKKICEPQPPHQDHCGGHAVLLPAPSGGGHAVPQAQGFTDTLEPLGERDVFHQRNCRKPAYCPEGVSAHEHRLVARCDAGEAREQAHEPSNHGQQWRAAVDLDVEAT